MQLRVKLSDGEQWHKAIFGQKAAEYLDNNKISHQEIQRAVKDYMVFLSGKLLSDPPAAKPPPQEIKKAPEPIAPPAPPPPKPQPQPQLNVIPPPPQPPANNQPAYQRMQSNRNGAPPAQQNSKAPEKKEEPKTSSTCILI
jgi:hypothetical protein